MAEDMPPIAREVDKLWRRDLKAKQILLRSGGSWWARAARRARREPRTEVLHLYRWLNAWADDAEGMAFENPINREASPGHQAAPRKMWLCDGWTIRMRDRWHLQSTLAPPENHVLLASSAVGAKVLVQHRNAKRCAVTRAAMVAVVSAVSFFAAVITITQWWPF